MLGELRVTAESAPLAPGVTDDAVTPACEWVPIRPDVLLELKLPPAAVPVFPEAWV